MAGADAMGFSWHKSGPDRNPDIRVQYTVASAPTAIGSVFMQRFRYYFWHSVHACFFHRGGKISARHCVCTVLANIFCNLQLKDSIPKLVFVNNMRGRGEGGGGSVPITSNSSVRGNKGEQLRCFCRRFAALIFLLNRPHCFIRRNWQQVSNSAPFKDNGESVSTPFGTGSGPTPSFWDTVWKVISPDWQFQNFP